VGTLRLLITGCERSATGYTAALLSRLGVPCGHEAVFSPWNLRRPVVAAGRVNVAYLLAPLRTLRGRAFMSPDEMEIGRTLRWPEALWGESSWLAAPYLARLPEGTVVVHQVREPLAVVRSLVRLPFAKASVYRTFTAQYCPTLVGSMLEQGMQYWVEWNQLIQRQQQTRHIVFRRLRIEEFSPPLLNQVLALAGIARDREEIQRALDEIPRNINTRGARNRDDAIRWETLPGGRVLDEMVRLAREYGYHPFEPSPAS
jgi:hypothetical protein